MVSVSILSDPAVRAYIFYSGLLGVKMLFMSYLTARQRYRKNVFANEEDAKAKKGVVKYDDPDVERVRRAHLNDLENIPVFWVLGALYLTTGPSEATAISFFRICGWSRIAHTIVYAVKPMPQPARAIAFGVPMLCTLFMGANVIIYYFTDM